MSSSQPTPPPCHWFSALGAALDPRSGPRLAWLFVGAVLARGRRTVTAWIRAAGLSAKYRPCYTTVAAAGARADRVAARLARAVVEPLVADAPRLVFARDDTPTPRAGPCVPAAGVHHNPTPGPAGGPFVYGHVWVVLGLLTAHPAWGTIALPLLARRYVRAKGRAGIPAEHRPVFRTKLVMAVELMTWAKAGLGGLGKPLWVVADGAYATADVLEPMRAAGVTVVSRLRKDAALWHVPKPRRPGERGRTRVYGDTRVDLAERGGSNARVVDRDIHPVRPTDREAVQDIRGHLAAGRGCDPGRPGGRVPGVGRVLLFGPDGHRGRCPGVRWPTGSHWRSRSGT